MLTKFDEIPASERVIVALDCSADDAIALADKLAGKASWVKIGMTLYYAEGPAIVALFKRRGFKVFLDLKFHDIPHQVEGAARSAAASGADMITMHTVGGVAMMQAAQRGAQDGARSIGAETPATLGITVLTSMDDETLAATGVTRPLTEQVRAQRGAQDGARSIGAETPATLGITVLTSMDDETLAATGVTRPLTEQVRALAGQAREAGIAGVVASPQEASMLREVLGSDAYIVTPGVRPAGAALGDQSRVATPEQAFAAGASHIVIGRPITQADDPLAAFEAIAEQLDS